MREPSRCTGPPALDTLAATTLYAPHHAIAWNDQRTQSSGLGAYRATVGEPFKKKANAVFPSLEAVCGPLPFEAFIAALNCRKYLRKRETDLLT